MSVLAEFHDRYAVIYIDELRTTQWSVLNVDTKEIMCYCAEMEQAVRIREVLRAVDLGIYHQYLRDMGEKRTIELD